MKLSTRDFHSASGLVGTVIVLTDDDHPTGVEHSGNFSKNGTRDLLKKVRGAGLDEEECQFLLAQLLRDLREQADASEDETALDDPGSSTSGRRSQASQLVDLALSSGAKLFQDERGSPYVILPRERREIWPAASGAVKKWLSYIWWCASKKAASRETLASAIGVLSSMATFEGPTHPLFVRVAWLGDVLYYDLGDWRAVAITRVGWEIIEDPPILFRHYSHQLAQPEPVAGGDFNRVLEFLSPTHTADETILLKTSILLYFVPGSPRPAQSYAGPQGSGKSTTAKMVKRIVDPSGAASIRRIADFKELQLQLEQNWLLNIDNVTSLKPEISDALAAAITGDSDLRRQLYTDQDLLLLNYRRPMVFNGITHAAERPDLLDRTILITLARIPEGRRMEEEELWPLFDAALPQILGGAFDVLSRALAIRPDVRLTSKPRMADAAAWGFAIAEAAGWGGLAFLAAYERNISRQAEEAVSSSVVAQVVVEFMDARGEWQGLASSLKPELDEVAAAQGIDTKDRKSGWPQDAPRLAKELRRLAETLTASGVEVTFPSQGKKRSVRFRTLAESTVGTVGSNGWGRGGEAGFPEDDRAPDAGGQPGYWTDGADGTDGNELPSPEGWSEEL